jgi:hypothetical protein
MSKSLFPPNSEDAERTYKRLLDRGRQLRAPFQCQWYYTNAYAAGIRNARLNFRKGTVKGSYTDARGRLHFVYEELLANYETQRGRLLGLDLSPRVVRRNDSLDGQRAAAVDQAVLNHLFPASRVDAVKRALLQPFLFYGTVGLILWESPDDPKDQDIRLMAPWHITPIPTSVTHPGAAMGLIFQKRMAIEQIREKFKNMQLKKGALAQAQRTTVNRADLPDDSADATSLEAGISLDGWFDDYEAQMASQRSAKTGSDKGKTDRMDVAWLGLVYLWDERNYMTEQLVFVGNKFLGRTSFHLSRTYKPVTTIHAIDTGGFWSRSWMQLQQPMNSEDAGADVLRHQSQCRLCGQGRRPQIPAVRLGPDERRRSEHPPGPAVHQRPLRAPGGQGRAGDLRSAGQAAAHAQWRRPRPHRLGGGAGDADGIFEHPHQPGRRGAGRRHGRDVPGGPVPGPARVQGDRHDRRDHAGQFAGWHRLRSGQGDYKPF